MSGIKGKRKGLIITLSIVGSFVVIVLIALLSQIGWGGKYTDEDGNYTHIKPSNSFNYVYDHPVWEGNGRQLFSVWEDEGAANATGFLSLKSIYFWCGWDIDTAVDAVNYLIDCANKDSLSIRNIYSEEQIEQKPALSNAQLVFYKGRADMPVAIVAAGGGYAAVRSETEGYPYAKVLNELGYNVFVLRYRVGDETGTLDDWQRRAIATEDLAQAVKYIDDNCQSLGVSLDGYSIWGSSAGGGLATLFSLDCNKDDYANCNSLHLPAPSCIVQVYTDRFIMDKMTFTEGDPAMFVIVGEGDAYGGDESLDVKVPQMQEAGIEVEYHKIDGYPHGVGLGNGTAAEGWIYDAITFWEGHIGG